MPELPEVETSRRGIAPWIEGQTVTKLIIRERRLRWPIPASLEKNLSSQKIHTVRRRAKYLLFDTDRGSAILHLGMSGSVRIIDSLEPATKHDHVDMRFDNGKALRFRDPRRFGSLLWALSAEEHKLLRHLGPEPLSADFDAHYLWKKSRARRVTIKQFIMNASIVVGIGNIYASEALFGAGIHPKRAAGRISAERLATLVASIKSVLERAIEAGGTTLQDFYGGDGEPGYFKQQLNVYGRDKLPCQVCKTDIRATVLAQRSTFYCHHCQR
jgi:formamidopyrimidine-DNA glycosylase